MAGEKGCAMNVFELTIAEDGTVRAIYGDGLPIDDLREALGGEARITRASDVEPTADCRWQADMGRVGGPVLGPFASRAEALAAEVEWLKREVL